MQDYLDDPKNRKARAFKETEIEIER